MYSSNNYLGYNSNEFIPISNSTQTFLKNDTDVTTTISRSFEKKKNNNNTFFRLIEFYLYRIE